MQRQFKKEIKIKSEIESKKTRENQQGKTY